MTAKQMEQGQPARLKPDLQSHYGSIRIEAVAAATLCRPPALERRTVAAMPFESEAD